MFKKSRLQSPPAIFQSLLSLPIYQGGTRPLLAMPRDPKTINTSGLRPTHAPDSPGATVPTTVRVREDQKAWMDAQSESASVLVRRALDLLMNTKS